MRPALPALALLLLLAAAPPAQALEAASESWHWRVLAGQGEAQVRDELAATGPGADVALDVPGGAHDVQAFVAGQAAPWEWIAPGEVQVHATPLEGQPNATVDVLVLYVAPVPVTGAAVERTLRLPVRELTVRAEVPDGWAAEVDGQPAVQPRTLGPLAAGATLALRLAPVEGPSPALVLGGLLLVVLAATMLRAWSVRGKGKARGEMGLLEHLAELASRLRVVFLVFALLMLLLFGFALRPVSVAGATLQVPMPALADNLAAQTFRLLSAHFTPPGVELVVVDPVSAVYVQLEVAAFLAALIGSPVIAYELGAFLMPALTPRERRLLLRAIPAVTVLFVVGASFAYLFMVPTMMHVLYSYAAGIGARTLLGVDELVSFAVTVVLMFGLAFELPVAMVLLAQVGIVEPATMARYWRHTVVGIFLAAAIITPDPSVVSQLLIAIPLCVLYGIGLVAAKLSTGKPLRAPARAA